MEFIIVCTLCLMNEPNDPNEHGCFLSQKPFFVVVVVVCSEISVLMRTSKAPLTHDETVKVKGSML